MAHGALITGLSSLDYDNFTPAVAQSDSDTTDDANQVSSLETAFPATLQQVSSYDLFDPATGDPVPHQAVNVITGQYIPNPTDPEQGNQRLFTDVTGSVEYTSPSDTQFTPPTIDQAEGVVTNGQVNFSVVASSPVAGTTVKEVLVLFKDATDGGDATTGTSVKWTQVLLSQGADGTWSGGQAAPPSGQVSFIVQAVDSDGNVAMSSNKGVDFTQVPAVQSTGSGLTGAVTSGNPQTDGYYTTTPVTETLTGPAAGTPITYSVDGGATATAASPVQVNLSSDGTHKIIATDPEGDTTTQTVGIETQNPTVNTEIAAPEEWQQLDQRRDNSDHQCLGCFGHSVTELHRHPPGRIDRSAAGRHERLPDSQPARGYDDVCRHRDKLRGTHHDQDGDHGRRRLATVGAVRQRPHGLADRQRVDHLHGN